MPRQLLLATLGPHFFSCIAFVSSETMALGMPFTDQAHCFGSLFPVGVVDT